MKKHSFRQADTRKADRQKRLLELFDQIPEGAQTALVDFLEAFVQAPADDGGDDPEARAYRQDLANQAAAAEKGQNPFGGHW